MKHPQLQERDNFIDALNEMFPNTLEPKWGRTNSGCGRGWHPLIILLFHEISEYNALNCDSAPSVQVRQFKEKFGTLRFYISPHPEALSPFITAAERASQHICEECGAPGELNDSPIWVKTLCPSCK